MVEELLLEFRNYFTEDELRKEKNEKPDGHSNNCYFIVDITPQEVEEVYRRSLE